MERLIPLDPARWQIVSGKWTVAAGIATLPYDPIDFGGMNNRLLIYPIETVDGEVSADVQLRGPSGQNAWLVGRYRGMSRFYSAGIGGYEAKVAINVQEETNSHAIYFNGKRAELAQEQIYNIRFTFRGDQLEIFLNGVSQGAVTNRQYRDGNVGLKVNGPGSVTFSNISIRVTDTELDQLIAILKRFRECVPARAPLPSDENAVHAILWTMLRAQYDDLQDEETLRRLGLKNYRCDLGIPRLSTIVEAKYVDDDTDRKKLQEALMIDVGGYLAKPENSYRNVVFFLFNAGSRPVEQNMKNDLKMAYRQILEIIEV